MPPEDGAANRRRPAAASDGPRLAPDESPNGTFVSAIHMKSMDSRADILPD